MIFIVFVLIVLFFTLIRFLVKRHKRLSKEFEQSLIEYKKEIDVFSIEYWDLQQHYISKSEEMSFISKWHDLYARISKISLSKKHVLFADFEMFKGVYGSLPSAISNANETFIRTESVRYNELFSNIDGKALDDQQRTAVITDEDRTLVLAGAGSGKTLTIAAKVKYLCDIKSVSPQNILLISFTRKSAQEMTERIQNRLGIQVEATTFHKFGLDIIKNADGIRPDVADEYALNQFVRDFFENELLKHPDFVKDLTEFFSYYLEIPDKLEDCASLGEFYEKEKNADLETLKSKYDREQYIRDNSAQKANQYTTLNNEIVKSIEETKIANFLFLHGVNYEYEKLYPYDCSDPLRKTYRPDFYLTDYDIYLDPKNDFLIENINPNLGYKDTDKILWVEQQNNIKILIVDKDNLSWDNIKTMIEI